MGIFSKKKNGDYFIEMIRTLTETSEGVKHLKEGYDDHIEAGRRQRKEDNKEKEENKEWQKAIDLKLVKAIECPRGEQIDNIEKDVNTLKTDKVEKKGKFLGMKLIWVIFIGVGAVIMLVLNVMWKFGML